MILRILIFTIFIATTSSSWAVPEIVENAFKLKYPDAKVESWEMDNNGFWEAGFKMQEKKFRADFSTTGEWIETERSLEFEDLPERVQNSILEDYPQEEISEIEAVDHATKGRFYDVEFKRKGINKDVEFDVYGERLDIIESVIGDLQEPIGRGAFSQKGADEMGRLELTGEFGINLITIFIFAYVIYYRRHHDHKMLFLLLGFNLFLFPIFLLSASLTAGFGFTIFALLALVRLRSDTFSKAEVAYLLGAVALTFINAMMPARVEFISSALVLLTAYFGDHPNIWRGAYQTVRIRYPIQEKSEMLNMELLQKRIAEEYQVEVNNLEIERVEKKELRLIVMYRDLPEIRKERQLAAKKKWRQKKNAQS